MYTLEAFVERYAPIVDATFGGLTLELCDTGDGVRVDAYSDARAFVVGYTGKSGQITVVQSRAYHPATDPARVIRFWLAQQLAESLLAD